MESIISGPKGINHGFKSVMDETNHDFDWNNIQILDGIFFYKEINFRNVHKKTKSRTQQTK